YFMSLEPDGFVVRVTPSVSEGPGGVGGATPIRPGPSLTLGVTPIPASHPYGIGRQEFAVVVGGRYTAHERHNAIGVRMVDVVGRLDVLAIVGDGAALAAVWHGLPVDLGVHVFRSGADLRGTGEARFPLT